TFPAASLAWKISEEDFMERFGNISQLKVRTGWGKTGNQNIVPFGYNTTATYQPDAGLPGPVTYFGTPQVTEYPALFILGVANQNVGWETTTTINIGLDLSMWDNRLLATIDVYDKTTTDLLLDVPLADMFAVTYGNYIGNAGEVNNKGLDLTLSYRNKLGDLDYEIGGNFSTVKNEVVSLEGGAPLTSGTEPPVRMIEGKPIGAFWGWVHEGIFESEEEIQNSPEQLRRTGVGDIKFKDLNKDGVIDDADQHVIGYALPDFSYGLSLGLSYRNFDLNILTQGIYGNSVYNNVKSKALYNLNVNTNVSTDLLNYYGRILDDGSVITDTDVPRLGRDNNNNDRNSTYFLEDGSYLRVKSASLSYSFSDLLRGIGLSDMRVYFTAQNLFTFTKYSGYNPEIGVSTAWDSNPLAFGIDNAVYPQPRTFLFGLDISF
ncbi:MAG: TonB-dependent receptor, partial [Bacteroidota bacterium]